MVRVGLIGAGYWGPNLVRTLNEIENAELVCVADLRPGRREFIEKRFHNVQTTADANDILRDPSIDAVFIATPPDTHYEFAVRAMKSGKHVFVEKPLAPRVLEAEQMVALAEQSKRTLAVGHLFLYHPAVVMLRALLDSGDLGDVFFLSSTRSNLGPPNTKVDVLWDLAPHDLSIVLYLIGESPCEVNGRGASFTIPGVIETAYVNLRFPSGRMAQVNVSWLTPNKTRVLQMVCSRKTVVYDDMQPVQKIQVFDCGQDNRVQAGAQDSSALGYGPGSIWVPPLRNCEPLRVECEDFIRCVETGAEPVSSGRRAVEVVRVLEAASASIRGAQVGRTGVGTGAD